MWRKKEESKELKELRIEHSNTDQDIGHKNYQIEKLREDKKELVGQHRNLQRRHEALENNFETAYESDTALVAHD